MKISLKKLIIAFALCALFNAGSALATESGVVKEVPTLSFATHYEKVTTPGYDDLETPTLSALTPAEAES